jgi:phage shock protein A
MGIFSKISDVFKANINELLAKSDAPEKIIKEMVLEIEECVNKTTLSVAAAIDKERQLEKLVEKAKKEQQNWMDKAVEALKAGSEELARKALEKKHIAERNFNELQTLYSQAVERTQKMHEQLNSLKMKLKEARIKKNAMLNEEKNTTSFTGVAEDVFSKYDLKIKELQAEAEAFTQLADENSELEQSIKTINNYSSIENELKELKKDLGL